MTNLRKLSVYSILQCLYCYHQPNQKKTAIDQLHQTKLVKATQGAVIGVFPEARQIVEGAIEEVLNNKKSPQQALDDAAKEITTKIQDYNRTVK